MMFLQYFVWGAWYVTMGTWLGETLHFSGEQIGLACGHHRAGGDDLAVLRRHGRRSVPRHRAHPRGAARRSAASCCSSPRLQTTFGAFYGVLLALHAVLHADAGAEQLALVPPDERSRREFPPIRVLGTIGWIVAGLSIGSLGLEATATPLQIAAAGSIAARAVLPGAAAHAAAREAAGTRATLARHARARRAQAARRALVCDFRARIVPGLHPAAVLLRVRQPVPERAARDATRPAR